MPYGYLSWHIWIIKTNLYINPMLCIFPFQYDKQWDGIRTERLPIFRLELEQKCLNMTSKDFQKWMVHDAILFHVTQMLHPHEFKLLQDETRWKNTPAFRRKWIESKNFDPKQIFSHLFGVMPMVLTQFSTYLYSEHLRKKTKVECQRIYLKYRLPIRYQYWTISNYNYTEVTTRTKRMNRVLSFLNRTSYNRPDTTLTIDMNKHDSKYVLFPLTVGMALLCLEPILPTDLNRLCALYADEK